MDGKAPPCPPPVIAARRPFPRCLSRALVAAALLVVPASIAQAAEFTFEGRGYGHGVGLGQYGAEGYARQGWTYDRILAHFYTATTIGQAPISTVRLLLQEGLDSAAVRSANGLTATDEATGATAQVPAAAVVTVSRPGGLYTLTVAGAALATGWAGPVMLAPTSAPVVLLGRSQNGIVDGRFRGRLRVQAAASGSLMAINVASLEDYLRGVVPREVPSRWMPETLKAQAVAARSYAIATRKPSGPFDMYIDERSQVYGGIDAEQTTTNDAVAATTGQVLTYGGKVITAYFSSSTGGRSAAVEEVFTNAKPTPYLVAVEDAGDAISPYHRWKVTFTSEKIASALGYAGTVTGLQADAYPSGHVRSLRVSGSAGPASYTAATVRRALGLRSTWFLPRPGGGGAPVVIDTGTPTQGMRLNRPKLVAGRVLLTGKALPGAVTLQLSRDLLSWLNVATQLVAADGGVAFERQRGEARAYRLSVGASVSNAVLATQRTSLLLRAPRGGTFRGRIYPAQTGARVLLQRVQAGQWRWVETARTASDGTYRFKRFTWPGRWRVRYAGTAAFEPSTSPEARIGRDGRRRSVVRRLDALLWPQPSNPLRWPQFEPKDPLYAADRQWNTEAVHAFSHWDLAPVDLLATRVKVAVIDGGIDAGVVELKRLDSTPVVSVSKRFTEPAANPWPLDHGTAVAGIIAGQLNNGFGFAGVNPWVELFDLRVVGPGGSIDPSDEARAIRWAVDNGARVINLSLGGVRDERNPARDQYSAKEKAAIMYAYRQGAVIVASVGNSAKPYTFASWPAALPHVIGVSAVDQYMQTPLFSNRDPHHNDIAAPGVGIVTTMPRSLVSSGLSSEAVQGGLVEADGTVQGTSFAAPHVSAAAALLFAVRPSLRNDQVIAILKETARDIAPPEGSPGTKIGRDALTGNGLLDVDAAVTRALSTEPPPTADHRSEPNDVPEKAGWGLTLPASQLTATIDRYEDPADYFRIRLAAGERITLQLDSQAQDLELLVWPAGTAQRKASERDPVAISQTEGSDEELPFEAETAGVYFVEVLARKGGGEYSLSVTADDAPDRTLVGRP